MATKRRPKTAATSTPQLPPVQPPAEPCRKCGHTEHVVQLRRVLVTIGWQFSQYYGVVPARMCTKCGDKVVIVNAEVGDLAGLIPDTEFKASPGEKKSAVKKKSAKTRR